jgi:hypothetical protein
MKFRDLFVPRYLHSDPNVRIKFLNKVDDKNLIQQMSEKDEDQSVRAAAIERLQALDKRKTVSAG